jgi:ABC-2 type transport system permease protein
MLWYKGWLETRIRLLVSAGLIAALLIFVYSARAQPTPPGAKPILGLSMMTMIFTLVVYSWLAGAGIVTQPAFQATKGLHGSTLFTLSLPVSRFRLMAIRASLGWIEMAAVIVVLCLGLWLVAPQLSETVTAVEMFEHTATLVAGASVFYFVSVLLAIFLDDAWRMWAGMIIFGVVWFLSSHIPLPTSVNIMRAMSEGSPLLTHTMQWTTAAFSLGLSAALFIVALKSAQTREY